MSVRYPGVYRDHRGEETITIRNDGETLRMVIRGVEFAGPHVLQLGPTSDSASADLAEFSLIRWHPNSPALCCYVIDYDVPIPVVVRGEIVRAVLRVHAEVGEPDEKGYPNREDLGLTLILEGREYPGNGTSGWFEDELLEIQAALPEGVYLKACINCAFSDYSVYGHGIFGDMLCFRDNRAAYLAVRGKREYMAMMGTYTEHVQETYLCPEFERRGAGTGYRG